MFPSLMKVRMSVFTQNLLEFLGDDLSLLRTIAFRFLKKSRIICFSKILSFESFNRSKLWHQIAFVTGWVSLSGRILFPACEALPLPSPTLPGNSLESG